MRNFQERYLYLRHNSGSVLIIAMWALIFFSILGVGLYNIVSSQITVTKILEARIITNYAAKGAVNYAIAERKIYNKDYDSLYELKKERKMDLGKGSFTYYLEDEGGKIDLNTAPEEVIERLPGLDQESAKKIIDYRNLRKIELIEEVLLSEGVDEETFSKIKNSITVYSAGKVNINTASEEVLTALISDPSLVIAIKDFRAGGDKIEGTEDDNIFKDTSTIANDLGMTDAQINAFTPIAGMLSVNSKNFSVMVEAKILDKPYSKYNVVISEEKKEAPPGEAAQGASAPAKTIKIKRWSE